MKHTQNNVNNLNKKIINNKRIFWIIVSEVILFVIFLAITKFLMPNMEVAIDTSYTNLANVSDKTLYTTIINDLVFISIFEVLFNLIIWMLWHTNLNKETTNNQNNFNKLIIYWILFNIVLITVYSLMMLLFEYKPSILGLSYRAFIGNDINRFYFLISNVVIISFVILIITNISKYLVMRNLKDKFFKVIIYIFAITALIPLVLVIPFFTSVWSINGDDKYNYIVYPSLITFATISPILTLINPFYSLINAYSWISSNEVFGYMHLWTKVPTTWFTINLIWSSLCLISTTLITFYINKKYLVKNKSDLIINTKNQLPDKFIN
ncbi:hypothetical protein GE118_01930 [Mycoplasma sp. NEAQ87857]|uniref:hypothetical protein n=1 Tax=Mycoplasma sp. NEAQ87857 TaxID=2683967 RepID=UPI0013169FC1|nr:hypothetical protein [Mycoplasma sp. NEAQ87857]QGZ97554.1 hypothetical protein GE118_01930 [Mycoplasma sp. NEAQ87857]